MIRVTGRTLKYMVYGGELFLIYILQFTPGLIPTLFGEPPMMLTVCAISISLFEGDVAGMWFGLAAGLLLDIGSTAPFGLYGLIHMSLCFGCGMLVMYLMRNNLATSLILGAAAVVVTALLQWVLLSGAGLADTGLFLAGILLPRLIWSLAFMPAFYYLNRAITTRMYDS